MKTKIKKFGFVSVLALLSLAMVLGAVNAHSSGSDVGVRDGSMHGLMGEVIENGSYADLVALRREIGFNVMAWVDDESDFELAKERHEAMEQYHDEKGFGRGSGMMGFGGFGSRGLGGTGCPMNG